MPEEVWQTYQQIWTSPDFIKKSEQAKKNRRGGDLQSKPLGSHTGGSISTLEWKERLERDTGETIGVFPLYKFTHTSKENKEDGWLTHHREFANKYLETVAAAQEAASQDESSSASIDPDKIFLEVAGGVSSKGRVFGIGSAAPAYCNLSQASSSSSKRSIPRNPEQQEEIDALKEQLRQVTQRQDEFMNFMMSQQQQQQQPQQSQQQGYSHMLLQANYSGQPGFYPSLHHPTPYSGLGGIQPPMRPAFTDSAGTFMPLHPQATYPARGSTPLRPPHPSHMWTGSTPFVQLPNNQGEAYYPIPPSPQQPSEGDES